MGTGSSEEPAFRTLIRSEVSGRKGGIRLIEGNWRMGRSLECKSKPSRRLLLINDCTSRATIDNWTCVKYIVGSVIRGSDRNVQLHAMKLMHCRKDNGISYTSARYRINPALTFIGDKEAILTSPLSFRVNRKYLEEIFHALSKFLPLRRNRLQFKWATVQHISAHIFGTFKINYSTCQYT